MHPTRSFFRSLAQGRASTFPTLVALGLMAAACGTDVKSPIPKFPYYPPSDDDAGSDASSDDVTCTGGSAVGATEERTRYEAATVPVGETCKQEKQTRTCEADGTWSDWSGTSKIFSCEVETEDTACEGTAEETRVRWAIEVTTTADGGSEGECVQETQTRTCAGGTWGGWSGTYELPQCEETFLECDGKAHGTTETRDRYEAATVNPGAECKKESQTHTCNDGEWSDWTGTFTAMACEVLEFANCDDKPHGTVENRTAWEAKVAATCKSEPQTRTCDDGEWSDWEGVAAVPYEQPYCDVTGQARCEVPGGTTIAHGAKYTWSFYPSETVPYGQTCVADTQEKTCDNGTLPPYTGTATKTTCTTLQPVGCVDGATTKPHGATRTQLRFQAKRVAYNASCVSETQTSTCANGVWSAYVGAGNYTETECKKNCDGGDHGVTQTRTRYTDPSVASNKLCTDIDQEQTRTCTDGVWGNGTLPGGWNGSATYDEDTCVVRKRDCTFNGKTVLDGDVAEIRKRYKEAFPTTACESQTQTRTCNDGTVGPLTPATITFTQLACSKLPAKDPDLVSCRYIDGNDRPRCLEYDDGVLFGPELYCETTLGGTWDGERGCPTDDLFATCVQGGLAPLTEYHYVESTKSSVCSSGTWHEL